MDESLLRSTGLGELDRKLVTFWTLGTHTLPYVDTFPMLVLLGKMGTGKSQALSIIGNFAYHPVTFSLRGMTAPAIRDEFAGCHEGTAIVEEADSAWNDKDAAFERMLSDRYQRASARASHKVPALDSGWWESVSKPYFGATALHRRIPFVDAALDGRAVPVRFRPDHNRQYEEFADRASWNAEGRELISALTFEPPRIEQPENVAARVFNSFRVLLSAAQFCGDLGFAGQVLPLLLGQTAELKEAQSSEPDGLVLRAIVEAVFFSSVPRFSHIKYSDISKSIWDNQRFPLQPRQIGVIARELGFNTKVSHGRSVVIPTPAALLQAADECGCTDEAIEELRLTTKKQGTV